MCMDTCKDCGAYVDTDADAECYVEVGNMKRLRDVICLCARCREDRERMEDAEQAAADACLEAAEQAEARR